MRATSGITLSKCSQFQNETNLSHAKKKSLQTFSYKLREKQSRDK